MVSTNAAYVNELGFFDDMYTCLESTMKDVNIQIADFEIKKHSLEMQHYFEDVEDYDVLLEKEGEGVLAKIGNAIIKIISKITSLVKSLMDKILGNTKQIRTDEEIVNKMIKEHPELQYHIVKGIDNNWFTARDIAPFEKDIVGLIQMLEKNAIDHQTFKEKVAARCVEFTKSAAPYVGVITTAGAFMGGISKINKGCVDTKKSLQNLTKTCEEFKDRVEHNYGEQDVNKAKAIINALGNVIGVTTKECEHRVESQTKVGKFLNKIANSKAGKLVHADDDSRTARHDKVKDKIEKKQQAQRDAERNKDEDDYLTNLFLKQLTKVTANPNKLDEIGKKIKEQHPEYSDADIEAAKNAANNIIIDNKEKIKNKNKNNP